MYSAPKTMDSPMDILVILNLVWRWSLVDSVWSLVTVLSLCVAVVTEWTPPLTCMAHIPGTTRRGAMAAPTVTTNYCIRSLLTSALTGTLSYFFT